VKSFTTSLAYEMIKGGKLPKSNSHKVYSMTMNKPTLILNPHNYLKQNGTVYYWVEVGPQDKLIKVFHTKVIKKVGEMEYFRCMHGNTAEAWTCTRSNGGMLRVWFNCSPFVPREHGIKMTVPVKVCTKDKQHELLRFFVSEE
jgi:hypothetical protein